MVNLEVQVDTEKLRAIIDWAVEELRREREAFVEAFSEALLAALDAMKKNMVTGQEDHD